MNKVSSELAEAAMTTASLFRKPKKPKETVPSLQRVAITGWILGFLLAIVCELISIRVDDAPRHTLVLAAPHPIFGPTLASR